MPPRKSNPKDVPDLGLTTSNVAVIRSALLNLKSFECDWEAVRSDIDIANKKHAPRDFNRAIAKLDLEFRNGQILSTATAAPTPNDDNDNDEDAALVVDSKADVATAAKGNKRKAGQDGAEGAAAKGKKTKKTKKAEEEKTTDKADDA